MPAKDPLFTPRFFALWTFAFFAFLSAFQLIPAIPFRILALGHSKAQAGLFLTVYTFASAFAAPLMGALADHFGRKRVLVLSSTAFIVFSILYGIVTHFGLLLAIAAIHGALWSALMASSAAIMTEYIPESRRTEGLAYWGLSSTTAIGVAPSVGLFVFNYGWPVLCGELAVLSAIMAVWSFFIVKHDSSGGGVGLPRMKQLFDWRVTLVALSLFTICVGYGGATSYVALMATERHIPPRGLFFAVMAVTIILTRVTTSRLGDRYGVKALLFPSLLMIPPALLILAFATHVWQIVAAGILFGAGFGGAYPSFASFVLNNTDPRMRGRTFGSIIWAFDTGIGSGSMLTGLLVEARGYTTAFALAAALSCLAIPIFMITSPRLRFEA
jgi:MFS family permease